MQITENHDWGKGVSVRADYEWLRLLDKARRGDQAANDRLAADILEYARKRVRILGVPTDDTADVAQACAIEVVRHLPDYDSVKGRFDGWVSGFALNAVRNYGRTTRRTKHEVGLDDVPEPTSREDLTASKRAGLESALVKLSARDKQMLQMKFNMGLTSEEIAEHVRLSPTQVRKRISRVLERLRRQPAIREILSR